MIAPVFISFTVGWELTFRQLRLMRSLFTQKTENSEFCYYFSLRIPYRTLLATLMASLHIGSPHELLLFFNSHDFCFSQLTIHNSFTLGNLVISRQQDLGELQIFLCTGGLHRNSELQVTGFLTHWQAMQDS